MTPPRQKTDSVIRTASAYVSASETTVSSVTELTSQALSVRVGPVGSKMAVSIHLAL